MTDFAQRRRMMVDTQVRPSDVTKFPIIEAMLQVPRERYVPAGRAEAAYVGENIPLGPNRVLLEARTLAKILDALAIAPTDLVLHVGAGLGYGSAVMARMAEAVVALEQDEALASEAEATLAAEGEHNVAVIQGALSEGAAQHGPYDVIVVEGGVEEVPSALTDQLKDGGRIACLFMDGALGVVRIGHRHNGAISWRHAFNAGAPVLSGFTRSTAFVF